MNKKDITAYKFKNIERVCIVFGKNKKTNKTYIRPKDTLSWIEINALSEEEIQNMLPNSFMRIGFMKKYDDSSVEYINLDLMGDKISYKEIACKPHSYDKTFSTFALIWVGDRWIYRGDSEIAYNLFKTIITYNITSSHRLSINIIEKTNNVTINYSQ